MGRAGATAKLAIRVAANLLMEPDPMSSPTTSISFPCPRCQKTIKANANHAGARFKCPGCGQPIVVPQATGSSPWAELETSSAIAPIAQPERKSSPKPGSIPVWGWLLIGGGVLSIGLCLVPLGCITLIGMANRSDRETQSRKVADSKDAIHVDAVSLYKAFEENEVKARQVYADKVVEVMGIVESVKGDHVKLQEKRGHGLGFVEVYVEGPSQEKMASLRKDQSITVRGICRKGFAGVNIESAVLLENPAPTLIGAWEDNQGGGMVFQQNGQWKITGREQTITGRWKQIDKGHYETEVPVGGKPVKLVHTFRLEGHKLTVTMPDGATNILYRKN